MSLCVVLDRPRAAGSVAGGGRRRGGGSRAQRASTPSAERSCGEGRSGRSRPSHASPPRPPAPPGEGDGVPTRPGVSAAGSAEAAPEGVRAPGVAATPSPACVHNCCCCWWWYRTGVPVFAGPAGCAVCAQAASARRHQSLSGRPHAQPRRRPRTPGARGGVPGGGDGLAVPRLAAVPQPVGVAPCGEVGSRVGVWEGCGRGVAGEEGGEGGVGGGAPQLKQRRAAKGRRRATRGLSACSPSRSTCGGRVSAGVRRWARPGPQPQSWSRSGGAGEKSGVAAGPRGLGAGARQLLVGATGVPRRPVVALQGREAVAATRASVPGPGGRAGVDGAGGEAAVGRCAGRRRRGHAAGERTGTAEGSRRAGADWRMSGGHLVLSSQTKPRDDPPPSRRASGSISSSPESSPRDWDCGARQCLSGSRRPGPVKAAAEGRRSSAGVQREEASLPHPGLPRCP